MPRSAGRRSRQLRHLYVIILRRTVLNSRRFSKANPAYLGKRLCLYVGLSSHLPEKRFEQHKGGMRASGIVRKYGKRVFREKCKTTLARYPRALQLERELAVKLRAEGYAVLQN